MANDDSVQVSQEEKKLEETPLKSNDDTPSEVDNEDIVNEPELGDEETRIVETKAAEEKRIAEEKASEEMRIAEAKAAEETRVVEEKAAEELRIAEEKAAEEIRIAEEKAVEETRIVEERAAEELRIAEEKATEETRIVEEKAAEAIGVAEEEASGRVEEKATNEKSTEDEEKETGEKETGREVEETALNEKATEDEEKETGGEVEKKATKEEEKENPREAEEKALNEKAAEDAPIVDDKTAEYPTVQATELTPEGAGDVSDSFKSPKATSSATTPRTAPLTDEATHSSKSNNADGQPKEEIPGENIHVPGRRLSNPSPQARKLFYSPLESPSYVPKSAKSNRLSLPQIDPKLLPPLESKPNQQELNPDEYKDKLKSIRERFEKKSSEGASSLVFGEAFREKKRTEIIAEKNNKQSAISQLRGFDVFNQGDKTAMGEVDTSHLSKTFVFEGSGEDAHGGVSLVDYKNNKYAGYAFLVHPSRGLLLLKSATSSNFHIPGGPIKEDYFLNAGTQSASAKIQLQLAARAATGANVSEATGIEVSVSRLKPAVLEMNPRADSEGKTPLKNEYEGQDESRLYYFLQVSEEDFNQQAQDGSVLATPLEEPESSMKLNLPIEFAGFTFAKEPMDAALMLNEESTHARVLKKVMMVTDQAVHAAPTSPPNYQSTTGSLPESSNTAPPGMLDEGAAVGSLDPNNASGNAQEHKTKVSTITSSEPISVIGGVSTTTDIPNSTQKQSVDSSSKVSPDYSAQDAAKHFAEDAAVSRGAVAGEVTDGNSKVSNETVEQGSYLCCCFM